MIKELVGKPSTIRQVAAVEDDPQRRKPDISRAKKYLGWEPKVCVSFSISNSNIPGMFSYGLCEILIGTSFGLCDYPRVFETTNSWKLGVFSSNHGFRLAVPVVPAE
jgi:hypothetical protein